MRQRDRSDPLDEGGRSDHLRALRWRAAPGPLSEPGSSSRVRASTETIPAPALRALTAGPRSRPHRHPTARQASDEGGEEARYVRLDEAGQLRLGRLGLRVPHRRQKRAFAESDSPHCPQFCTPTCAPAPATSRADASQNDPRSAAALTRSACVAAAPRDRYGRTAGGSSANAPWVGPRPRSSS